MERCYLALLKYRTAQTNHEEIRGLANMMIDLKVTMDWYPDFRRSLQYAGMARIEGGGAASALESMKQAIALEPEKRTIPVELARSMRPQEMECGAGNI